MKRLGRVLCNLLAVALTMGSLQAMAETQVIGRDFNHMTTGYPLLGGHATAACESCHVGGVFKGTLKKCDECHAVGRRVLATPKSNTHIVTDAQCDSCHFNTATWFGARYNHGTAVPGQCTSCHNGRLSMNKPTTHNTGNKATKSCDSCHRSTSWLPASWNHTTGAACSTCHATAGGEVSAPNLKPASHVPSALKGTLECDSCHNYTGWLPARFKHNTGAVCSSCHNGVLAVGPATSHSSFIGWPTECNQCHFSTTSFANALGAKPANHILYTSGTCSSCHTGGGVLRGATLHAYVSTSCKTCHNSGSGVTTILGVTGRKTLGSHEGSNTGQDCTSCHRTQYTSWNKP